MNALAVYFTDYQNLTSNFLIPLLSLCGLAVGFLLSYIAKEELPAGEKYFIIMSRVLFVFTFLSIAYFLSFQLNIFFLLFSIVLAIIEFVKPSSYPWMVHYLLFLTGYFLSGKQIIVAAIIFLYGLPVGTILGMRKIKMSPRHE